MVRRLARQVRPETAQVIHQQARGTATRSGTAGTRPPKKEGADPTLAEILRAAFLGLPRGYQLKTVARALIATAGSLPPRSLSPSHVLEVDQSIAQGGYALATRLYKANCLRQILRWLWENHGAPKLDAHTTRHTGLRPRNVTVTDDERAAILAAAPPYMRMWTLMCSDMAIRSGTAAAIGPDHYDPTRRTLRFTTKKGARQTLPVTGAIQELIDVCDLRDPRSFVRQLHLTEKRHGNGRAPDPRQQSEGQLDHTWRKLLTAAGITRRIVPHDLRRTAAVAMLEETRDIRDVQALLGHRSLQSTIWYLDHDLRPVELATLERIKRPYLVRKELKA
ncbi:MAG TPA: tyrosine-type recombinase/integrase [Terracidiphilus sp.]|nr:tyrosine-type recombinase/integrase [Terracidiphilus sp.]